MSSEAAREVGSPFDCFLSMEEKGALWRGGPNPTDLSIPGEKNELNRRCSGILYPALVIEV